MSIRIILADDHRLVRDALRAMLGQEEGLEVVAEAEDGRAAVELTRELRPDVVIMDVIMPVLNGVEATRQIAEMETCRVLALSMHTERRYVVDMFRAGAKGYLLKTYGRDEFLKAIRLVAQGKTYVCPKVAGLLAEGFKEGGSGQGRARDILSDRELEVLKLVAEGKATKEIASLLFITARTVELHRQKLMEKLGIHSVAGLTKFAIREGLTSIDA